MSTSTPMGRPPRQPPVERRGGSGCAHFLAKPAARADRVEDGSGREVHSDHGNKSTLPGVTSGWCLVPSSEWMFWAPLTSIKHSFVTAGTCIYMDCWGHHVYTYIYICVCVCVFYMYIYTRERERGRDSYVSVPWSIWEITHQEPPVRGLSGCEGPLLFLQ